MGGLLVSIKCCLDEIKNDEIEHVITESIPILKHNNLTHVVERSESFMTTVN
jgi:hypothetical protein